jgi:hypothetical protein
MRTDKHLDPLQFTKRQAFFLTCWFNMVHRLSLDSYRARVMNPINVLRELRAMYAPQADEFDRRRVAEEALDILRDQPVLRANQTRYAQSLADVIGLIAEAIPRGVDTSKAGHGFAKHKDLIYSFVNQLEAVLKGHFLQDCFAWLDNALVVDDAAEQPADLAASLVAIERVCRDLLSVSLDNGISLESLFQLYRHMAPTTERGPGPSNAAGAPHHTPATYVFMARFHRVRDQLASDPTPYRVIFGISNISDRAGVLAGSYGGLTISKVPPAVPDSVVGRERKFLASRKQWLWVDANVEGKDGRAAGMTAYRSVGQILDLVRFQYDSKSMELTQDFLLEDEGKHLLLTIPQLIPNPENELPARNLEEFVQHLNSLAARDGAQAESRDRIFAAFRLYRAGAEAHIFENKLVNWWTGTEYLTKGSKSSAGSIGASVEEALAPTLSLVYLPKHLGAYRNMLAAIGMELQWNGSTVKASSMTHAQLYGALHDPTNLPTLEAATAPHPYLWHHLKGFIENLDTPPKIAAMLRAHEQRVRWQVQRIYRARCDIVHSAQLVVNAVLLCANLEYYLRMTLQSMLTAFQEVPTLSGPVEFFERRKYQYDRILAQLEHKQSASDTLLTATLG